MSTLSPNEQFSRVKKTVEDTIAGYFPIKQGDSELRLNGLVFTDKLSIEDLRSQKAALRSGGTWAIPVMADMSLYKDGKMVNRDTVKLFDLPKTTGRLGYIFRGNEYQPFTQLRLKSGVYHRVSQNGEIQADFNLANREQFAKGRSFKIILDPEEGMFYFRHGTRNVPAYHLLKASGATDKDIQKAWGSKVLDLNKNHKKNAKPAKILKSLQKMVYGDDPVPEDSTLESTMQFALAPTQLLGETTKKTLGREATTVDSDVLLRSTGNLLGITRGDRQPDDASSLAFQSVHSMEDLLAGRLKKAGSRVKNRIAKQLRRRRKVSSAMPSNAFQKEVNGFFSSSLMNQNDQMNPLTFLTGARRTTIMGEQGGIQSAHAVRQEQKLVNPSHLGFLDPIHTPEGERTGVSLALASGVRKDGNELKSTFYTTSGKSVALKAGDALGATVAFPDQMRRTKSGFKPKGKLVKATRDGKIAYVSPKDVDYVLPSPRALFGVASNLIPFLQNNQGNRAMTAARQQEQAVALIDREAPLVQVKTDGDFSFEAALGSYFTTKASAAGVVTKVTKDSIFIKDSKGNEKETQFYHDFPLKGGAVYNATPIVKKGDKVKKGQRLVESNFTRDGKLALGTNLKVAYMPFRGLNFEDGIVISEKAAKKLTSMHMYTPDKRVGPDVVIDRRRFVAEHSNVFRESQIKGIQDNGLIRVGSKVQKGDPLVLALAPPKLTAAQLALQPIRTRRPTKLRNRALLWDKETEGTVTDVVRADGKVTVYVKTDQPAQIGDKLVGRHGNKGVITSIIPDAQMPYEEGRNGREHIDIAMNPLGVPGRINVGQVLETAAGRVAAHQGAPVLIRNFDEDDYLTKIRGMLDAMGLRDKVSLINPESGKPYTQKILTGNQYVFKLHHTATKGMSARAGAGAKTTPYSINQEPSSGTGAQRMGELGTYALLAHGAKHNLYDMMAYKTSRNPDIWNALRNNSPLPPPKTPFVYDKFLGYLKGMRVNTERTGNSLQLVPYTEAQVKKLTGDRVLTEPGKLVRGKNMQPIKGGLFDEKATGGIDGTKWSRFELPEAMPNPLFEDAIKKLLDLSKTEFEALVAGRTEVDGKRGGDAIEALLKKINVDKELLDTKAKLKRTKSTSAQDKLNKKARILMALKAGKLDPSVYIMRSVPVIPPTFRPLVEREDGTLSTNDINGLYQDIASIVDAMASTAQFDMPPAALEKGRTGLYNSLKAYTGMGGSLTREYQGILDIFGGTIRDERGKNTGGGGGKAGFFQQKIIKRRQDYSGRAIITPAPELGLDEVGLPEAMAWKMYAPFVQRQLLREGMTPIKAKLEAEQQTPRAYAAMRKAVEERPLLMKRDPALHKFNVMAFKPRLTKGKALEIHPLITGGFNADFDGDKMGVFLPLSEKAKQEAYGMMPSNNLFSPTTGKVMHVPGHEALLGAYLITQTGKKTNKAFSSFEKAELALESGEITATDIIKIDGKEATLGRWRFEKGIPAKYREIGKRSVSQMRQLDKKGLSALLRDIAKNDSTEFGRVANHVKDLGNDYSYTLGYSIGLDDFKVINKTERDSIINSTQAKAQKLMGSGMNEEAILKRVLELFEQADTKITALNNTYMDNNRTNISAMIDSGARAQRSQLFQITSSPLRVKDAKDQVVPYLIPKSYGEGMDVASYWATMHGARKGTVQKVQGVRDPGALSKSIVNSSMNQVITVRDCGTTDGIMLSIDDRDVVDRYLSTGVRIGKNRIGRGNLVTPALIGAAKQAGVSRLPVRSAMRCKAEDGICQMCFGLSENGEDHAVGTNIGIIASQAIGEPSTQLSLNSFHCHHENTLIRVRVDGEERTLPMVDAFYNLPGLLEAYPEGEEKDLVGVEIADKGGWVTLEKLGRHKLEQHKMLMIRSESGHIQFLKDNHPVMVRDGRIECPACGEDDSQLFGLLGHNNGSYYFECPCGERLKTTREEGKAATPRMRFAESVEPGVYVDIGLPSQKPKVWLGPDPYLIGMYAAEGSTYRVSTPFPDKDGQKGRYPTSVHGRKLYGAIFSQNQGPVRDKILEKLAGTPHTEPTPKQVKIAGREAALLYAGHCGGYSASKHLPHDWSSYGKDWWYEALAGLLDGDGGYADPGSSAKGPPHLYFNTTSVMLVQQLCEMLERLRIKFNVLPTTRRDLSNHQSFVFRIYPHNVAAQELEGRSARFKADDFPAREAEPALRQRRVEKVTYVAEIQYGADRWVYDVTAATGTFYAGCMWTHNTGGLAKGKGAGSIDKFKRLEQLLKIPETLAGAAALSRVSGKVTAVRAAPQGGNYVSVGSEEHYVPHYQDLAVKKGDTMRRGDTFAAEGAFPINPRHLLDLQGIRAVQDYISTELNRVLQEAAPIRRRNIEVVTKALTNVTRVDDSGGNDKWITGDMAPTAQIQYWNAHRGAGKKAITHSPVLKSVDVLPQEMQEDWMARLNYRNLKNTVIEAAREGWQSNIHGFHPIPGLAMSTEFGQGERKLGDKWRGQY